MANERLFGEQDYDDVKKPAHYTQHSSSVECCEISKYLSSFLGQAFQYLWRYDNKGGVQDLEKAVKCIEIELTIERPTHLRPSLIIDDFNLVLSAETDALKAVAMRHVVYANTCDMPERRQHLARAISIIADMVLIETCGIGAP
jgi:hypothetical protein